MLIVLYFDRRYSHWSRNLCILRYYFKNVTYFVSNISWSDPELLIKKITSSLYFYERKMYFLYSVDVHVQQNVPGRGVWKACKYNCQGKSYLVGREVPNYFFLFCLERWLCHLKALEIPSLKKEQDFLEPIKRPLHVHACYSPLLFSHRSSFYKSIWYCSRNC